MFLVFIPVTVGLELLMDGESHWMEGAMW